MKVVTAKEMRKMDGATIKEMGIPGIVLMENAARHVAEVCIDVLEKAKENTAFILVGKGNNGGDGLAVARILKNRGYVVEILIFANMDDITGDARINLNIAKNMKIPMNYDLDCALEKIEQNYLIIDGVYGTGLHGEVRQPVADIFEMVNKYGKYVVSIDIPSGISANTGAVLGTAIQADETVTFVLAKRGLLLYPGAEYTGKVHIMEISMPKEVVDKEEILCHTLTKREAMALMPVRIPRSNKGNYGRLFVIAGSKNMTGAAALVCKAGYKTGAGVVYGCTPQSVVRILQTLVPSVVEIPLKEKDGQVCGSGFDGFREELKNAKAIVMGCGLGLGVEVQEFVQRVLEQTTVPVVLDADGLNAVANEKEVLKNRNIIVTPHPGEMSRLTGKSIEEILQDTIGTAQEFSKNYGVITVLKDAHTIIAHPDGRVYINTTGNAAMAKGGSGDVLCGIIGGLLAQGMDPFWAAILGVYIHGSAGNMAAKEMGMYGVLAEDLVEQTVVAMKGLSEGFE